MAGSRSRGRYASACACRPATASSRRLHRAGDCIEFVLAGDALILRRATRCVTDIKGFLPKPVNPVSLATMAKAIRWRTGG